MFIVKKKVAGKDYYYLQKSIRKADKVISECVAYLGKDKQEAEKKAEEIMKTMKSEDTLEETKETELVIQNTSLTIEDKTSSILTIEELTNFCKRKGFVYSSGEIYGGLGGFWDFGHLGSEFKNNIKKEWWKFHVHQRDDMVGIDGAIITNPKVWEASGHVSNFVDLAVICKKCKNKTKIDKHEFGKIKCDKCGGEYENKGEFNPMFVTQVGPIKEDSIKAYLRPETAQLIFADFKLVMENARMKFPFGISQVGKSFRNEISPREFLFRSREFEQMEIEYFISPEMPCPYMNEIKGTEILIYSEQMQKNNQEPELMNIHNAWENKIIKTDWHAYWIAQEYQWFMSLGANPMKFRVRQHCSDEKSHYAIDTWDMEYKFPMGWRELQGFANRGNFDLSQHQKFSGEKMEINENGKTFIPHVVCEPSLGVERAFLVFMFDSYFQDIKRNNIILKLNPKLSPIKAAVFPIVKQPEYEELSEKIIKDLRKEFKVAYDKTGSIGRRYARNDEIGTPYCITIDENSIKNQDVTIRDRDTTIQIRVKISELKDILRKLINQEIRFKDAGKIVETRVKEE
jgi:glycyl-tRNA synthetase